MKRHGKIGLVISGCAIAIALTSGCAAKSFESSAPGPRVPRISNFRIDPAQVENGGDVTLRFDFQDLDGDVLEVYLGVTAEIKDFSLATGLQPAVISRGHYLGQVTGTAEETIKVTMNAPPPPLSNFKFDATVAEPDVLQRSTSGIRVYHVFVVDQHGQVSNYLRARVTVRSRSAQGQLDSSFKKDGT